MGFVNKVMLLGNTTRNPESRTLPTGNAVCEFGLATNRIFKTPSGEERQETVFVDCTAFGRQAEVLGEYLRVGKPLFIEGRLHFHNWEDTNGQRRSKLTVIIESFQFVGGRSEQERQGELPLGSAPAQPADSSAPRKLSRETPRYPKARRADAQQTPAPHERSPRQPVPDDSIDRQTQAQATMDDADLPF